MPSKKGSKWNISRDSNPRYWEYHKKLNPQLTRDECECLAKNYRLSCNKGNIKYWERYFPDLSHDEHVKLLNEYKAKIITKNKIQWWFNKYPLKTEEEIHNLYRNHMRGENYLCIEYYRLRFPELSEYELSEKLQNAQKIASKKQPKLKGADNPSHHSHTTLEERKSRSPKCIEFYQKRYPDKTIDECEEMRREHLRYTKSKITPEKISTRIEYWLSKGYSGDEVILKLKDRQRTFSLQKCIEKYGKEEGIRRFEQRQEKWMKSLHKQLNTSKISQSILANGFIDGIMEKLGGEKEYQLGRYSFDYRLKNILIEINGDYWHCNPQLYDSGFVNKILKRTAAQIWSKDNKKLDFAKSKGYKCLVIWENDINRDKDSEIQKCINFINENVGD